MVILYADEKGRIKLKDIDSYLRYYYEGCRAAGLPVEKKNSIFTKDGYTEQEAERNILANPFKRFEDVQMLRHIKTLGIVQVDERVWKKQINFTWQYFPVVLYWFYSKELDHIFFLD